MSQFEGIPGAMKPESPACLLCLEGGSPRFV